MLKQTNTIHWELDLDEDDEPEYETIQIFNEILIY